MPGTDVRISRTEDGAIRVAATPAVPDADAPGPAFTRAVLDVAGAVLVWPVLGAPGGLPTAEIHDPGQAQQWLWAVHGERVAAAVHACAGGGSPETQVPAEPTALAGSAARLGFGHWAARWWPASYLDGTDGLEPDVLGLELAALTHRCQQLFDASVDRSGDGAAELITEHRAALDPLLQWWHSEPLPAGMASRLADVLRLVDDAADHAGLDGPALRRLRVALGRQRRAGAPVDPGALFARRADYALAAGDRLTAGGRVIARGSGTNDWHRYPPGFVDAAENAVSWTARAVGARRQIEVEVVADAGAPAAGTSLVAEVRVDGGRARRVPLLRRDDRWTGVADLEPPAAAVSPGIQVGVLLPGFDPGPDDSGTSGTSGGAADRDAVRALARRRLAAAARPDLPDEASSGPFLAEIVAAALAEDF